MTRILYWNIEKFAFNKIADPSIKRQHGSSLTKAECATDRRDLILDVVDAARPDILVVVEVTQPFATLGALADMAGRDGCNSLLESLRLKSAAWALVPPLQTGAHEAVGVFFRSDRLCFSGPNVWPGGNGTAQPAGGVTGTYPLAAAGFLPPTRTVPAGAQYNAGAPEDRCAALLRYRYAAGTGAVLAGTAMDFGTARAPYCVTFYELGGAQRNLTLFAVHPSPKPLLAHSFMQKLAQAAEIVDGIDANEVRVVVGDFNINLMKKSDLTLNGNYQYLLDENYSLAIAPLGVPPDVKDRKGYVGYFATHIKSDDGANYGSTKSEDSYYPGYRYIGSSMYGNFFAIDNVFLKYGGVLQPPQDPKTTIMNSVSGTPFTAFAVPKQGTPTGSIVMASALAAPPVNFPAEKAPNYKIGTETKFQSWDNYGHIRSTSDHLAIATDV